MQNFHSIAGLSGRVFGAGDGGAAEHRRLRGYPSASMAGPLHSPLPVKCPRCDSVNTKFCYYNNYNLSQPRHFCKSCRRYWTKGGVLRNVPVGGGCRKPKRSSSKSNSADKDNRWPAASRSSSDSSSLTAVAGAEASASLPDSVNLFNSSSSNPNPPNPVFNLPRRGPTDIQPFAATPAPTDDIFSDAAESLSSLMGETAAANQSMLKFNFVDQPLLRLQDPSPPPPIQKIEAIRTHEIIHQMAPVELPHDGEVGGGISWLPVADAGFFELAGAGYPAAYWSQSHWPSDVDHPLYLP